MDCVVTNARPQSPTRDKAADWTRGPSRGASGKLVEEVHWDTAIPAGARHVDVVLVFTDVLVDTYRDHNDRTASGRRRGDAPDVIGSWSGDLVNGAWEFSINRSDLTPPNRNSAGQKGYPSQAQINSIVARSRHIVESRTSCALVNRNFGKAAAGGDGRKWDTGFDIVPAR